MSVRIGDRRGGWCEDAVILTLPFPFTSSRYDALEISTNALHDETSKPIPSAVLSSTPDPALTAFAQLGLYRMGGSRALVSLFDRKNQHIVAEAVRTTPLSLKDEHKTELWLCGTAVPRATSICEHVLAGPASSLTIPGNATGNAPTDLPVSVVLNLDEDARFCEVQDSTKRFYVGVPIRSPAGINIGVYCVFDDKPRQSVSADEIQFIRDMSRTIMDYLEAKRSHECYRREERMVRGLGSFVEGRATLSNWSQASNPSSFQDIPGVQEGSLNKKLRSSERRATRPQARPELQRSPVQTESTKPDSTSTSQSPPRPVEAASERSPSKPRTASPSGSRNSSRSSKIKKPRQARLSSADVLREDMENVFSKASNIIRESLEVEGVVYLDASVRTFGGMIGKELSSPEVLGKPSSDESSSSDEPPSPHADGDVADTPCKVLGFSTSQSSSVNGDAPGSPLTEMPEKHLHWLLQRYPHGKIYNMEGDAVIESPLSTSGPSSSDPDSELEPGKLEATSNADYVGSSSGVKRDKGKARQNVAFYLAKLFPGARSVAFVPQWDSQRNRWFAGTFVWTRTPTRIFTPENELAYLKVYGLTIMAEVTRLHIKAADKTKMDVLGSISHELRSPLHGVVGAVELLRQTHLDSAQERTLRTIQISSRTLLDTIDHLLDYGKMNGLIKSSKLERTNSSSTRMHSRSDPATPIASTLGMPVQLDRLAEEVIESVLAGYSYMNQVDSNQASWSSAPTTKQRNDWQLLRTDSAPRFPAASPDQQVTDPAPVRIYLDIEPAASWSFRMHPGAFRRICMNLFGNSLKFTTSGFISIHLRQEKVSEDEQKQGRASNKVVLTVSDSGKGISEEYIRNHLYTPFAQEDHFAPGTGLGLSLVRQVVTSMGGNIHVASEVGYGTAVTVSLPLPVEREMDEEQADFRSSSKELEGLRILFRGHDKEARLVEATKQDPKTRTDKQSQLRMIESICKGWFNMIPVTEEESRLSAPDFIVLSDECFLDLDVEANPSPDACPHIFVCRSATVAQSIAQEHAMPSFFELISQPIGPRKLAKSLLDSRRLWLEAQPFLRRSATDALLVPQPPPKPLLLSTPSQAADVTAVLRGAGIVAHVGTPVSSPDSVPAEQAVGVADGDGRRGDGAVEEKAVTLPGPEVPGVENAVETKGSVLVVDDNPINRKVCLCNST